MAEEYNLIPFLKIPYDFSILTPTPLPPPSYLENCRGGVCKE